MNFPASAPWISLLAIVCCSVFISSTKGETACSRILVHGSRYQEEHMGVYMLKSEKINGYVAYASPFPRSDHVLRAEGVQWVLEEKDREDIIGAVAIDGTEFPYNATGVWKLEGQFSFFGLLSYPEFKVECIDQSLWPRVGICEQYIIEGAGSESYQTSAEECWQWCLAHPKCVAISTSKHGCTLHHKYCLGLVMPEGAGFYVHQKEISKLQFGRSLYQSTVDVDWEGSPEKAVDGIYGSFLVSWLSCALTQREVHPWWAIDLGRLYFLRGIVVLTRFDCCWNSFYGVNIGGDPSSDVSSTIAQLTAKDFSNIKICKELDYYFYSPTFTREVIECTIPLAVQTVVIYKRDTNDDAPLTICEMQIIADEVSRYAFFEMPVPQTSADEICKALFGNGSLLELSSEEEYRVFGKFAAERNIQTEMAIADQTSPAARGIGEDAIFLPGEENVNAATEYLEATCEASTEEVDFFCDNVFEADDNAWMPQATDGNIWIKVHLKYYYKIYKLLIKQKKRVYQTLELTFSEGETYQLVVDPNGESVYDAMTFNGFLADSINITVSSVFNNEENGIEEIKVLARPRGMMAYDGECTDHELETVVGNFGECEVACLKRLDCLSVSFKPVGVDGSGSCRLMNGTCSNIEFKIGHITFKLQDEMSGYNVVHYTEGCLGRFLDYVGYHTLAECMLRCDATPECDHVSYCDEGWCEGDCLTLSGPCRPDTDITYRYDRRGGYRQKSENSYVGCYPYEEWLLQDDVFTLTAMSTGLCRTLCMGTNHTFYTLFDKDSCACGSSFGSSGPQIEMCNMDCVGLDGICGGTVHASVRYIEAPPSYCLTATTILSGSSDVASLEFQSTPCEKALPFVCVRDSDHCQSKPCKNNGTCSATDYDFTCLCSAGFTGELCETDVDDCVTNLCLNGATCVDELDDFSCQCPDGFTGQLCETEIDFCQLDPCPSGSTCISKSSSFHCECPVGYTGADCTADIDECANFPCGNFGTCTDQMGDYTCSCREGFTGQNCETEIDECFSQPCLNAGTCHDTVNSYFCECRTGVYEGVHCELEVNNCLEHSCLNNGTCESEINGYFCFCPIGFTGLECQSDIDECSSSPCENGASCYHAIDSYWCECVIGFIGENCSVYVGNPASWEAWSSWTECSSSCEDGLMYRSRECIGTLDDMEPYCGDGTSSETIICNSGPCPPVDGNWGPWIAAESCPSDCGMSSILMYRECDTPSPQNGGNTCVGDNETTLACLNYCVNDKPICGDWLAWSNCEGSCESGSRTRTRSCMTNSTEIGASAENYSEEETQDCFPDKCGSKLKCHSCEYTFDVSNPAVSCPSTVECNGNQDVCIFEYTLQEKGSIVSKTRCGFIDECNSPNPGSPCFNLLNLGNSPSPDEVTASLRNLNDSCSVCCTSSLCNKGIHITASPQFALSKSSKLFSLTSIHIILSVNIIAALVITSIEWFGQ